MQWILLWEVCGLNFKVLYIINLTDLFSSTKKSPNFLFEISISHNSLILLLKKKNKNSLKHNCGAWFKSQNPPKPTPHNPRVKFHLHCSTNFPSVSNPSSISSSPSSFSIHTKLVKGINFFEEDKFTLLSVLIYFLLGFYDLCKKILFLIVFSFGV